MKPQFIILFTLLSASLVVNAQQEYRVAKSSGQLKINLTGVIVEGYDGKEIIFSGQKAITDETTDERAKGLVPISGIKYTDNTGLGISVTENGQEVNVSLAAKKPIGILTIKVPQNMKVSIISNSNGFFFATSATGTNNLSSDEPIVIKNLKGEIEVSVNRNKIKLENNTGPMNIKTIYGSIDAVFNNDIKGPVSIISVSDYVDVTLPSSTKANIEMGSNYGKLYAGKEFKIDLDKEDPERNIYSLSTNGSTFNAITRLSGSLAPQSEVATVEPNITASGSKKVKGTGNIAVAKPADVTTIVGINVDGIKVKGTQIASRDLLSNSVYTFDSFSMGGDRIKGKLNGGGIDLIFKSTNKNVYLRQQ
jgi:hypothetical protein